MLAPESFQIVVTDINHHVRNFLQRELAKEGYAVNSVKTGSTASDRIFRSDPLDLLILDPEIFPGFNHTLIEEIVHRHPALQIIIHTYADSIGDMMTGDNIHLVEKDGQSIGSLKKVISACYERFLNKGGS